MTLNARLMTGLIGVTLTGLLIMCGVSGFVLHAYLMNRVDDQLRAARDRAVARLVRPGLPGEGVAPPRYVVLAVTPAGRVRVLSGGDPDPRAAVTAVGGMNPAAIRARAVSLEPFSLSGMRAVARPMRGGSVVVVATPLDEVRAAVRNLVVAELVTAAVLVAALALAGRRLIGRGLLPLSRMAATAQAIAYGGDLRARMPDAGPSTEASRLAAAINVMLDRIEQAFWARARSEARVREFAADASHELRTPLTTIQGYAELYRHGALGPDELPEAMRRIEDEARRMSALVGDLLDLARLDREASLRPVRVDLVALARDAVADASAAGPDHPVALEAPDELVATVDEARVRQVLANLLANVRAHTPPGTAATVRLRRDGGGVLIEVADQGPGMGPEDAARAFERFHRAGDGSSGTGLGLPIVAAIAAAHGGGAQLFSEPGQGTVVRVSLRDLS
ncbi:two-component sensor histidine kinase [Actinomadura rubrobrunea]|uniref:histidine kinase n=1 Tax=Actinomadura rubrobrunea TaxID=115335 RepID=A0A9W6UVX8_9ACTN|nr:HAMP domain-containing sensor histidine kinase [Actinomadura rubrobrunea]GLW66106.1 two-component sensor histidine kinase [Actinomadura rubrobrunea]